MQQEITATDVHGNKLQIPVADLRWRPSAYGVIIKDGNVLALPAFGGYALVGGGLELGESIESALIREIQEEAGITVSVGELLGVESSFFVLPGKSKKGNYIQSLLLYYRCEYVSGELSDEGFDEDEKEYGGFPEWLPISSLNDIKIVTSVDWRKYVRKAVDADTGD